MCKDLKKLQEEYEWLKEVDSCSLRCAIFNLEDAYRNFFEKRNYYPVFKNKYTHQSYRTNCIRSSYKGKNYSNIEIDLKNKKIKLPKLGQVDIRGYRSLESISDKIINATITKETNGKYYYQVDNYYPSSKICSKCGEKTKVTNDLSVREWECEKCGTRHDRDINASINIMTEGLILHYGV